MHMDMGQGPDMVACRQRQRDIYLELQSARLRGGVRYCRQAWQGQRCRQEARGGGGWAAGTAAALGVMGCYPHRVGVGSIEETESGGRVSIGRFSWGADAQYADVWSNCATLNWFPLLICIRTIPGSGSGVSRAPPDKMSSRLQAAHWTCELELDFT